VSYQTHHSDSPVTGSHWRRFYFRRTSVFSALEVFYENALYKFTFDIDIDSDHCHIRLISVISDSGVSYQTYKCHIRLISIREQSSPLCPESSRALESLPLAGLTHTNIDISTAALHTHVHLNSTDTSQSAAVTWYCSVYIGQCARVSAGLYFTKHYPLSPINHTGLIPKRGARWISKTHLTYQSTPLPVYRCFNFYLCHDCAGVLCTSVTVQVCQCAPLPLCTVQVYMCIVRLCQCARVSMCTFVGVQVSDIVVSLRCVVWRVMVAGCGGGGVPLGMMTWHMVRGPVSDVMSLRWRTAVDVRQHKHLLGRRVRPRQHTLLIDAAERLKTHPEISGCAAFKRKW